MKIARYLALAEHSEQRLAEALMLFSDRHAAEAELSQLARLMAGWSSLHAEALAPWRRRHGRVPDPDAERLRSALFHDPRAGGIGVARDLHDLWLLGQSVHMCWTALSQAARAAQDVELRALCDRCGAETNQQLAWIRTHFAETTAQALTVPQEPAPKLRGAIPARKRPAALPDAAWAPLAGAGLVLLVGAASLLVGQPWLVPSLGPSAYLVGEEAAHPSARFYNVVAGHVVGLGAGFAAVWLLGAGAAPGLLQGTLPALRVGAAAIAMLLTMLALLPLRASHPPAAATTLLVALGLVSTAPQALHVVAGALVLGAAGEALRAARMGKLRTSRARAEARPRRPTELADAPAR